GLIELLVVAEHDDRRARVEREMREGDVRPFVDELVGARKALAARERLPRIDHDASVAEWLCKMDERHRDVRRADDRQRGRGGYSVEEDTGFAPIAEPERNGPRVTFA